MHNTDKHKAPGLVRTLGVWSATAIVIGGIIGQGVFLYTSQMARDVGSATRVLEAWLRGGVIVLFGAFCYAELGAAMPEAGGDFVYIRRGLGPMWGFLYGWTRSFIMTPASNAVVAAGLLRVSVEPEKISNRTWRISLKDLQNGEYGFLPPGVSSSSISASGKIYTFGVIEGGRAQTSWSFSPGQGSSQGSTTTSEDPITQVAGDGSIGVSSDENPKVRHDGVAVSRITVGGPASQAGIQVGDAILAIDDHYLFTAEELTQEIRGRKPGTRVAIRYRRHSTSYDTYLTVGHADSNH